MKHLTRLLAIAWVAMLMALLAAPMSTFAHERRTIGGGKYDVVVGWDSEPVYVGQKNGASIRISKAGTNPAEPVTGAEKTLLVAIQQGVHTKHFVLRAVFGQPGYYTADILPTRDGDYQWTFMGTVGGDQINEKFDTADGKFDKVEAASGLEFPIPSPDPGQVIADVQSARAATQQAQTLGMIGIGVGVLGLLVAIAAWLTRPRGDRAAMTSHPTAGERIS